ncbi:hypothetical protein ACFXC8_22025 [Streptomyces sp. NPDC059441]|uniref:hypothetical protein n=1 Tax=Streptomyces sp. NPDC059441 TaxID=3346829 RepID=UPI00367E47D5
MEDLAAAVRLAGHAGVDPTEDVEPAWLVAGILGAGSGGFWMPPANSGLPHHPDGPPICGIYLMALALGSGHRARDLPPVHAAVPRVAASDAKPAGDDDRWG